MIEYEGREYPDGVEIIGVDLICGVRIPIVRGTAEHFPDFLCVDGSINDGFFCGKTSTIYIRAGQAATVERDSISHERGHAFLALSGLKNVLEAVVTWPKGYEDFEETVVRIAAPHLATLQAQSLTPRST